MNRINRLICWWFGCKPDYGNAGTSHTPCSRCGEWDIDYAILVGDTRHSHLKDHLRFWLFRLWIPERCRDCGKRRCADDTCLPF